MNKMIFSGISIAGSVAMLVLFLFIPGAWDGWRILLLGLVILNIVLNVAGLWFDRRGRGRTNP